MATRKIETLLKKIRNLSAGERDELMKNLLSGLNGDAPATPALDDEELKRFEKIAGAWKDVSESLIDDIYAQRSIRTRPEGKL